MDIEDGRSDLPAIKQQVAPHARSQSGDDRGEGRKWDKPAMEVMRKGLPPEDAETGIPRAPARGPGKGRTTGVACRRADGAATSQKVPVVFIGPAGGLFLGHVNWKRIGKTAASETDRRTPRIELSSMSKTTPAPTIFGVTTMRQVLNDRLIAVCLGAPSKDWSPSCWADDDEASGCNPCISGASLKDHTLYPCPHRNKDREVSSSQYINDLSNIFHVAPLTAAAIGVSRGNVR